MGNKGQTVRIKPEDWARIEKAAVKLTIKKQRVIKPSDIVHRVVEDYLDDCVEMMLKEK